MSAWVLGSEMAASLGLQDFEFVQEYVAKGLSPHNEQGQPFIPAAVVDQFIQRLEHELAIHDDTAWNLLGDDRDELIANHIEPLQRRIEGLKLYRDSFNGAAWQNFELPADQDLSRHFIQVLLNSFYRREEVYGRLSPVSEPVPDQEARVADQVQGAVKGRKLRPEQRHRLACRAVAERFRLENPEMRSHEMILKDEIARACEGKHYVDETIRRWVADVFQNRRPGKPKKKLS